MNALDALPRFALVTWPDAAPDQSPSCIYLDAVPDAVRRGAVVIAREPGFVRTRQETAPNSDDTALGDD